MSKAIAFVVALVCGATTAIAQSPANYSLITSSSSRGGGTEFLHELEGIRMDNRTGKIWHCVANFNTKRKMFLDAICKVNAFAPGFGIDQTKDPYALRVLSRQSADLTNASTYWIINESTGLTYACFDVSPIYCKEVPIS